jgi:hypothetical protein
LQVNLTLQKDSLFFTTLEDFTKSFFPARFCLDSEGFASEFNPTKDVSFSFRKETYQGSA